MQTENRWHEVIQGAEICNRANTIDIRLPWCLGMMEAKQLCEKYRGEMTIITSSKMQKELFIQLEETTDERDCVRDKTSLDKIWTGFTGEKREGHFVDINHGAPLINKLDPLPFFHSNPDGGIAENCVTASIKSNQPFKSSWYDTDCTRPLASFCRFDHIPRLQIRGEMNICLNST